VSFLDDVKKIAETKRTLAEEITNKMPSYAQALHQLWQFIEQHLYCPAPSGQRPLIRVKPEREYRIDGYEVGRLSIVYDNRTATVEPRSIAEARSSTASGGLVLLTGPITGPTSVGFEFRWDGNSDAFKDHWQITRTQAGATAAKQPKPLSEETFDDALRQIFGVVTEA